MIKLSSNYLGYYNVMWKVYYIFFPYFHHFKIYHHYECWYLTIYPFKWSFIRKLSIKCLLLQYIFQGYIQLAFTINSITGFSSCLENYTRYIPTCTLFWKLFYEFEVIVWKSLFNCHDGCTFSGKSHLLRILHLLLSITNLM